MTHLQSNDLGFLPTTGGMKRSTELPCRTGHSFPQAIGLGATFDTELLGQIADTIATEGRAKYNAYSQEEDRDIYKGLTFWSPNVNIFRDPRWGSGT
ncbi:MAG: hypothetical protein ACLRMZ_25280 [Blautia marasmi]